MVDNLENFDWDKEVKAASVRLSKPVSRDDLIRSMSNDELNEIVKRIGKNWVVMNKAGTSLVKNPGSGLPFYTPLKKRAEQVALEVKGVVVTFDEAFKILSKLKP
jgi:hypothetical protein